MTEIIYKTRIVNVMDIVFWVAIVIFLGILAWWVLGSSPTIEQISLGLAILGFISAERAGHEIRVIKANTFRILEKVEKMEK